MLKEWNDFRTFPFCRKIPVVTERLKIQQTVEAVRSVHSRRSIAEIFSRPVAFDSNNLDNEIKTLQGSVILRSNLCSVNVVNKRRINT